jgi:acyl-CoA thioesterase I
MRRKSIWQTFRRRSAYCQKARARGSLPAMMPKGFAMFSVLGSRIARVVTLAGLSVIVFTEQASAEPRAHTHIICVGDSITEGHPDYTRWSEVLQTKLGDQVKVENFGASGSTLMTNTGISYNPQPARDAASAAGVGSTPSVIIALGTNDSKDTSWAASADQATQFRTDLRAMIQSFRDLESAPVVYVALPPWAAYNGFGILNERIEAEIIPAIQEIAKEMGVFVIDTHSPTLARPELQIDGVHPNNEGGQVLADVFYKGLNREPVVNLEGTIAGRVPTLKVTLREDNVPVDHVEFLIDEKPAGTDAEAPYEWTPDETTPLADGEHDVVARVFDTTLATGDSPIAKLAVSADAVTFTPGEPVDLGTGGVATSTGGSAATTGGGGATASGGSATSGGPGAGGGGTTATPAAAPAGCSAGPGPGARWAPWALGGVVLGLGLLGRRGRRAHPVRVSDAS